MKTLNTLQTNAQTLEKIRNERDKNAHLNIPNMLKFAERIGISVSNGGISMSNSYEPRREKTGLRGFRPGPT